MNNVYHRDIKPENVVLGQQKELVLIDFGMGKHFENNDDEIIGNRQIGTPRFLAPELLGKGKVYGRAADIWAAGLTLYSIASGFGLFDEIKGFLELKEQILYK